MGEGEGERGREGVGEGEGEIGENGVAGGVTRDELDVVQELEESQIPECHEYKMVRLYKTFPAMSDYDVRHKLNYIRNCPMSARLIDVMDNHIKPYFHPHIVQDYIDVGKDFGKSL